MMSPSSLSSHLFFKISIGHRPSLLPLHDDVIDIKGAVSKKEQQYGSTVELDPSLNINLSV